MTDSYRKSYLFKVLQGLAHSLSFVRNWLHLMPPYYLGIWLRCRFPARVLYRVSHRFILPHLQWASIRAWAWAWASFMLGHKSKTKPNQPASQPATSCVKWKRRNILHNLLAHVAGFIAFESRVLPDLACRQFFFFFFFATFVRCHMACGLWRFYIAYQSGSLAWPRVRARKTRRFPKSPRSIH